VLAEQDGIVPKNKDPKQWLMHLRKGVTFHDGRPFTSADVVYSFKRIIHGTGKGPYSGATGLGPIDINGVKALDKYTVYVPMTRPFSTLAHNMAAFWYYLYIAPVGFNINKPVGTGPFMYKSFKAGQQSVFVKNPHYFISGRPYADSVTIIDFADSTSLQNALVTKVIQAAGALNGPQIATLTNTPGIKAVVSHAGTIIPFTMRVDHGSPFADVRVRQALRYVVDRPQMIDSALDGYGTVGNDVFSPYDPAYNHSLHRAADIPHAKKLLQQAGKEGLTVTLTTSAIATGTIAMATVLKQQAAQAGITIKLNTLDPGAFFTKNYLGYDFAQDFYNYSPYMSQVAYSMLPQSPFNETHNDNAHYTSLYNDANKTFDPDQQKQILHEMQDYDFNEGGYIIPAYVDSLDAYSTDITGYTKAKLGQPLGNFTFENLSFVK